MHKIVLCSVALLMWEHTGLPVSVSAPTNGVYVALGAWRGNQGPVKDTQILASDKLLFHVFCNTGIVELAYPDFAYSVRLRLLNDVGEEVNTRALGSRYGSKFDKLRKFSDSRAGILMAWGSVTNNPELGGGRFLATVDELFKVPKPGAYKLQVQFQMFMMSGTTNSDERWRIIRFQPVELQIMQPRNSVGGSG